MKNQSSSNLEGIVEDLDTVNEKLEDVLDQLDEFEAEMKCRNGQSKASDRTKDADLHKSTVKAPDGVNQEHERKFYDPKAGP